MILDHEEYVSAVARGEYPEHPLVPKRSDWFSSDKGVIENVLFQPMGTTSIIRSRKGSVRANHYHKTDSHYLHVISGECLYFWRAIGSVEVKQMIVTESSTFFTPPLIEHAVLFLSDTVLLQLADHVRTKAEHESDLVRVELVSRQEANMILSQNT
jgi:dTDP-4-dehydrorhamnose 3,5-epimerase-like enzyme